MPASDAGAGHRFHRPAAPSVVVWDIGNVLYDWDPRHLYERLIADAERRDWFLSHVVTHEWHFQHDAGRPFAETSAELIADFPAEANLVRAFGEHWLETIAGPTAGTHAIVAALARQAVPQYALSNFSAEFWPRFAATAPILRFFRDIVVSGQEGLVKPDPAIYALACQRFGQEPSELLFIDDNATNVEAARACGWHAIHFTDAASLRLQLAQSGFEV